MHVFVSLPFEETFDPVFETVSKVAILRGLNAIRADRGNEPSSPSVIVSIEKDIRDSRFIIADLTDSHPNVLQEVRYASELGKPRVLISQESPEQAAFNVQGLNIYQYDLEDLDSLQSLLLKLAVDPLSTEKINFGETTTHETISTRIDLMDIVPRRWENPFAEDSEN